MKDSFKLGIIGGGFMSHSIIKGILSDKSARIKARDIKVSDISLNSLKKFQALNVNTTLDNKEIVDFADYVILAIKPQNFNILASELKENPPKNIISIMAGIKKETIKKVFDKDIPVARCMPNTPISIGLGTVAIDASDFSDTERDDIFSLFYNSSVLVNIEESKIDTATAINGSGPAYVYMFIDALIKSGVNLGLSPEESRELALHTVIGGAQMVKENSAASIDELIAAVSSKGGTTEAATKKLLDENFYQIIDKAVKAGKKRAGELPV